jgi:hypothetical protein
MKPTASANGGEKGMQNEEIKYDDGDNDVQLETKKSVLDRINDPEKRLKLESIIKSMKE